MDLDTVDRLLTTTRSVRKRLDLARPVEPEIIERCIEIATQAPTGSNRQGWHFLVVTDADKRAQIGRLYRQSFELYAQALPASSGRSQKDEALRAQNLRVRDSAWHLAHHMGDVPVLIIPCVDGRVENAGPMAQASTYGSILPAAWSLMLALRSRGLGAAWTTLHLRYEKEVAALLNVPDEVTQAALLPVAYYSGDDFKPAQRLPAANKTYWNGWGSRRASAPRDDG
jgi:nitroreductase